MSKTISRLGKGLSAIIAPRSTGGLQQSVQTVESNSSADAAQDRVNQIPLEKITPNPNQPRTNFQNDSLHELAQSIRANGVLQPILVRPLPDKKFELVAGERRWRAAKLAELKTIPAIVHELTDAQSVEIALIENLQRDDLTPLERATAYQHYIDMFRVGVEELAQRLSQSRANIANYLRLLKLRPEIREMISSGQLGMGQARAIAGILDPQKQLAAAKQIIARNLSTRQAEALAKMADVQAAKADTSSDKEISGAGRHKSNIEEAMSKALGMTVKLFAGKKKNSGRIIIRYNSLEEFDRIAERIGGGKLLE